VATVPCIQALDFGQGTKWGYAIFAVADLEDEPIDEICCGRTVSRR